VGQSAEDMHIHLMAQHHNKPEVQKLPDLDRVRELKARHHEVEEFVRHDIIYQPVPEDD